MIKLKIALIAMAILLLNIPSFAQEVFCKVSGNISGLDKAAKITISRNRTSSIPVKTTVTKINGDFSFTLPAIMFNELYDLKVEGARGTANFIAEKGTVKITGEKERIYLAVVKGTPENDHWNNYQKFSQEQSKQNNHLTMNADKFTEEERIAIFNKVQQRQENYTDSLVQNYPKSVVALYIAKIPLMMMKHDQIDSLLTVFKPGFAKHPYYLAMKTRADILRKVAPGAIAPDFTVIKPDGTSKISLSSFRGKYVLLDFWASWCVPCREENIHTKTIYQKFNPAGLEVISFSLDSDIKAWRDALKQDGLIWHNASDLVGGTRSPVAKNYGIDGIPALWLIDPTGKIIAEGIRGETLEALLESIFSKNKGE
ncbi:Peroxiredoxin [Pedobacter insulae]|uniref:Peroxiredoxin n=2 Tax=Pedobacter insulae TaxID=414048 RepID=A0A1I2TSK4_9SPHI|nr:Peroxiredoxin [Pedobacter insulae]